MSDAKPKGDRWKRGRAFDLWSIPHFLFGVLMAFAPGVIGISVLTALSLTIILALIWEVYEKFIDIKETVQNILLDIILPIAAFTLTTYMLDRFPLPDDQQLLFGGAVFVLYAYTNISGWLAFRSRNRAFMD